MERNDKESLPECFGSLNKVFPMGDKGLRYTPPPCLQCPFKTECLREAMKKREGITVKEEILNRAYHSGKVSFFERWIRKKTLHMKRTRKE